MTSKQLTQRVEEALAAAHGQAVSRGNASLEPAHVALAMVQVDQSLLSQLAQSAIGDVAPLRNALAGLVNDLPTLGSPGRSVVGQSELAGLVREAQKWQNKPAMSLLPKTGSCWRFFRIKSCRKSRGGRHQSAGGIGIHRVAKTG